MLKNALSHACGVQHQSETGLMPLMNDPREFLKVMKIDSALWGQVFGPLLSIGFTKSCDKRHVKYAEKCPFPCLWGATSV